MKANELMIGDYIEHIEGSNPIQIEEIHTDGVIFSNVCYLPYEEIKPIPLTAEILEKNGFRKDLMYFYLNIDDEKLLEFYTHEKRLRLWFDGVDEWVKATVKDLLFQCQCKYVHDLQHALRLCNIEKEIKI